MPGPEDKTPKDLLDAPVGYPDGTAQASDILASGYAQGRRPPSKRKPSRPAPGPTTPEQVTRKHLDVKVDFSPRLSHGLAAFPEPPLEVSADITWTDATGVRRPWDPSRIHIKYGSNAEFPAGPGPYPIVPVFKDTTWFVRIWVDLYIDGRWKRRWVLESAPVLAFCAVDMTSGLSDEDKDFIATLYGEGGGDSLVSDSEVARVAWCMRRRVEFVRQVKIDADREPGDQKYIDRLKAVKSDFSEDAVATYHAVLSKPGQFAAWGKKGSKMAREPRAKIVEPYACTTLARTRRIALEVKSDAIVNFDAGSAGGTFFAGCIYYMTKKRLKEWKAAHPGNPKWDYETLPALPVTDEHRYDRHWYWPLKNEYPWTP